MDERLRQVFATALGLGEKERGDLSEGDSIHTVPNWDSLGHLRLILAIETEYGVAIPDEAVVGLVDVQRIETLLRTNGAGGAGA
jgi:acyl carrier protein